MKLEVYSVHDTAVGAFMTPFFCRSRGEALRSFEDAVTGANGPFNAHREHFVLYQVGVWSDENGLFGQFDVPDRVAGAVDFSVPA